jgi:hypothetical protein
METFSCYGYFLSYSPVALSCFLFAYRVKVAFNTYVKTGKWSGKSIPRYIFDPRGDDLLMGGVSSMSLVCLYVIVVSAIGAAIDFPKEAFIILLIIISICIVVAAFFMLAKRERNKKVFYDTLSGEQ